MLACKAGGADCVRLLLEAGADATLFDSLQQRTALHYAGVRSLLRCNHSTQRCTAALGTCVHSNPAS